MHRIHDRRRCSPLADKGTGAGRGIGPTQGCGGLAHLALSQLDRMRAGKMTNKCIHHARRPAQSRAH